MKQSRSRSSSDQLTELILDIFRVNGALLAAGDKLVGDLGLTSARWQVLGAIALSGAPQPVAHIARDMGLTRQAVQRLVDAMQADGLVELRDNPHHKRAKLVLLTRAGRDAVGAASRRQRPWARRLAAPLDASDVDAARRVLRTLLPALAKET